MPTPPKPLDEESSDGPEPRMHIFVCVNERDKANPKGCCRERGGMELVQKLKKGIAERGLTDVKVSKSGCLGFCAHGVTAVVYPRGVWYCKVREEDVDEIIDKHLVEERPVNRLRIPPEYY